MARSSLARLRTVATLTALALGSLAGEPARAEDASASLSACVQAVTVAARRQGAKVYGEPVVDFLLPGDQRLSTYTLPTMGCFGFLAFGHRQVHRLELTVYAQSGRVLARDDSKDAHAYTRYCGDAGRTIHVEVRMLDGEGELHLVPLWAAPATVDALEPAMQACRHAGTPRPSPMDVGPEPEGPPLEIELASVATRLAALGYTPLGNPMLGTLSEQGQQARRLLLEGGHCYALAAIGEPEVDDIDVRLLAMKDQPILVASDTTRRRNAIAKVCAAETGIFVLDVRVYRGGGGYAVQAFGLAQPKTPLPSGIDQDTQIPFAEMTAQLSEKGLTPEPLAWGIVRPGTTHEVPLRLRAGNCYALGAIATADALGGDLDLSLIDERGLLRSADLGANAYPLIYECPERDETLRAVVKPNDLRKPSRFLLVLGRSSSPEVALP